MTNQRKALGDWGEQQVEQWYRDNGYQVLARNWRTRYGELDLVVASGTTVAFCEVKTRTSDRFGDPAQAVT